MEASRARRRETLEALRALWPELERHGAGARLHLEARLHVAEAVVKTDASGTPQVVEGPLLREGGWTAGTGRAGVTATPEALEGLSEAQPSTSGSDL
jgi:hypothetical protein